MTLGEQITLEDLERDPYPIYARLRDEGPVSWVPAVRLWLVTRYHDVRTVCLGPERFTADTDPSTLNRTMGRNMLGSEGPDQRRIRAIVEPPFRPRDVEERTQGMIPKLAHELIDGSRRGASATCSASSPTRCPSARSGSCSASTRWPGRTCSDGTRD